MPRLMVSGFIADAKGRDLSRAYSNTSKHLQGYMSRTDFDYFASVMFRDDVEVDYGSIGRTVDGELAIFVGTYRNGNPWSQYVFVWESGWKFRDHTSKLQTEKGTH